MGECVSRLNMDVVLRARIAIARKAITEARKKDKNFKIQQLPDGRGRLITCVIPQQFLCYGGVGLLDYIQSGNIAKVLEPNLRRELQHLLREELKHGIGR
jgi:hypothetical protein